MADLVEVPPGRLQSDILQGLLEEYASRDGTDYGERETSLEQKVAQLMRQLTNSELKILYDTESEQWDILPADLADKMLNGE